VVEGEPGEDEGIIDIPLGRLNHERGWWQKPDPNGLPSVTKWRVLGRSFSDTSPLVGEVEREAFGRGVSTIGIIPDHPPPQPSPTRGTGVPSSIRQRSNMR
jgi:tRNA pseudouridine32 synthase/23S rRNA pseudouridine746 synthase